MKTLKLKLVAMLVVLFATIGLYAQCGQYGTLHTETITIGNCNYEVKFCITCAYGPFPTLGKIMEMTKLDPSCVQVLDQQEILDAAEAQLLNPSMLEDYCPAVDIPPCDEAWLTYTIETAFCWQAEYVLDGGIWPRIKYTPCTGSGKCIKQYTVCKLDESETYVIEIIDISTEGSVTCGLEVWDVSEPTAQDPGPTACYIIHTDCNP